ncbi:hypothetical protein [Pontibacillus marinus]|uniref:Uncharacterized protein n=1 Tax=Pontibacillus marinus BH030004 = DSM 16465 TaxID=1385511 RepID=A0A0A5G0E1_9BACI|nr:hypothetical protein [Pontibacillus marinus]KGX84563.1 hypothetical protein N783_16630 [Pontibacillus marinus BH030004 = DSM 16465]
MKSTYENEVWKISQLHWEKAKEGELSTRFYKILSRWVSYAKDEFSEWTGRPNCGYFFGGNFWYSSETSSTALVFAIVAKLGEFDEEITQISREDAKQKAIQSLRYMGFTHDTGPEDCVRVKGPNKYTSEKKWGGKGDHFFMASQNGRSIASIAKTAWLLWEDLDKETKILVQNMVQDYSDRFCEMDPKSGSYYDTQCEEDAWTSEGIYAAVMMFPDHPHHERWAKGAKNWAVNTVTTYWDRLTSKSGLIEKSSSTDIKTINFHPDYTTENHAFVHPSYLCAGINLRASQPILAHMSGQPIDDAAIFNNEKLYEKTVKLWTQFDGLAVPIQGQDWWYNRHHERQYTHAVLNVIHNNSDAARLERNCLNSIEAIQNSNQIGCLLEENEHVFNPEHAQSSRDFEPGSALDLANAYLLHVFGGNGSDPTPQSDLLQKLSGTYSYPHGNFIIHRTPETFTSFSWRNNVMLLNLPKQGNWNITPIFNSYTGVMKFESSKGIKGLTNEEFIRGMEMNHLQKFDEGFATTGTITRGDDEIQQQLSVISLPNGHSVYTEKITALKECEIKEAYTGNLGVRNENYKAIPHLAPGERSVYLPDKNHSFKGFIGKEDNQEFHWGPQEFLNLDHKIGFIINGSNGVKYINRHQYARWKGIEDFLILNDLGNLSLSEGDSLPVFTIVTMPNKSFQETEALNNDTTFFDCTDSHVQVISHGRYLVFNNFNTLDNWIVAEAKISNDFQCIYEGINVIQDQEYKWQAYLPRLQNGFTESEWKIVSSQLSSLKLEIQSRNGRLTFLNLSEELCTFRLKHMKSNEELDIKLKGQSFHTISAEHLSHDPYHMQ